MKEAPRPIEVNNRLAPQRRTLYDDGLVSGKGCVPGKTASETIELVDNGILISGRGLIP